MDELTRRQVLAAGAGAALTATAFPLTSVAARARRRPQLARGGTFSAGVASGQPAQRAVTLWTRLDGFERGARLRLEVARDRAFSKVVHRQDVLALPIRDHTVRPRISGKALRPGEEYFYRFETRTTTSPVGRFRTLRPPDSREPVRIGWFSCQRFEHGHFTPQAGLAADDDLDLVVSLGDYIYEEDASPRLEGREDPSGRPNGHVERLAQYRSRYRTYRSDPALQAMHAAHPMVAIWDDCEVEGNWAGDGPSSGPSPVGERSIPFSSKRANALVAFFEYLPIERVRGERTRIYKALRMGAHADLFLLDTRQYRDPQPCDDRDFSSGQPCFEDDTPGRKRLGADQKAWLKEELVDSRATWKVLGNAQMMMALDLPTGQPVAHDGWDGYAAERRELLEFARARGVRNLTSIVGDVHVFFAGDLHTTGRVDGPQVGTEFVGASVSHDALNLPALSPEESALLTERLPLANPHLKYTEFEHRGYAVLEASETELRVDFKAVDSVLDPAARTYDLQSFRVQSGVPQVELA